MNINIKAGKSELVLKDLSVGDIAILDEGGSGSFSNMPIIVSHNNFISLSTGFGYVIVKGIMELPVHLLEVDSTITLVGELV